MGVSKHILQLNVLWKTVLRAIGIFKSFVTVNKRLSLSLISERYVFTGSSSSSVSTRFRLLLTVGVVISDLGIA